MGASIDPQGALLITNQIVSYWLLPLQPVFNSSKQSVFPVHASAVSRGEGWGSGVKSHIQIKVYYTYHSAGAHRASHFIIAGNQAGQTWFAFGWLLWIMCSLIFPLTEVKLTGMQFPKSSFLPLLKIDSGLTLRPTSSFSSLGWFLSE